MKKRVYNTLDEIPDWGRPVIEKLMAGEALPGGGVNLGLSEDMLRLFVALDLRSAPDEE